MVTGCCEEKIEERRAMESICGGNGVFIQETSACVFPFVFDGRRYSSCTKVGTMDEKQWCATTDNYDKDGKWKHCSLEEYGGNSNGKPCIFPFVYKNRIFYTCTDESKAKGRFWCSTTSNFDLQHQWSYCADIRLDANPKGPCVFPFLYNGTSYSSCTTDGISNKKLWCSLTNNYDVDLKWTYCEPSGRSKTETGVYKLTTERGTTRHSGKADQGQVTRGRGKVETGSDEITTERTAMPDTEKVDQGQVTQGRSKVETGSDEITTERTAMPVTEKVDQGQVTQVKRKTETGFFKSTTERGAMLTTGKADQDQTTKGRSMLETWIFKVLKERESSPNAGSVIQCPEGSKIKLGIFESTTGRTVTLDTGKVDQGQITKERSKTEPGIFGLTPERGAILDTGKVDHGQATKGPEDSMESPSCVFPFIYKGKSYQSCTIDGKSDGTFWCATTSNYDADKKWKLCQVSGPDPDVESPSCFFPFIYKGKAYSMCTAEGMSDGKLWCATTSTYDVDKKWVYCNDTGPETSKEGPSCVFPFIYNGQNYSSCTEDGRTDGKLWCATTRNYDVDKQRIFCTVTKTGCIFPFIYKEKYYQSCIPVARTDGKAWCSTTPNYDTSFKWRLCNESDCTFPFVFRGKTYHSCATSVHLDGKLWCPLTSNPDKDRMWLLCADSDITHRDD